MKKIVFAIIIITAIIFASNACRKIRTPTVPTPPSATATQTIYQSATITRTMTVSLTPTISATYTITVTATINTPLWTAAGGGQASSGAVRFPCIGGYNGNVYIAYVDVPNGEKATVKQLTGSSWSNLGTGAISTGRSDRTVIYVVDDNNIYVAYQELDNNTKLTVKYYNGSVWSTVGTEGFTPGGDTIWQQGLCVDGGVPYIAFTDGASGKLYSYSGGNWAEVGSDFYSNVCWYIAVRFYAGVPYVFYQDSVPYNATVKYRPSGAWSVFGGGDVTSSTTEGLSMAVYNGSVYTFFRQSGVNGKAAVKTGSGSSWSYMGPGTGFSPGAIAYGTSIFADANGNLYALYGDTNNGGRANCAIYNTGSWLDVGTEGFSTGQITDALSLYAYNGTVYAAFTDVGLSNAASVMMHN
jgi:hypothetical protein